MTRLGVANLLATGSIVVGFVLRMNADSWSRNVNFGGNVTYGHLRGLNAFLLDLGAVMLAFGVLVLAVVIHRWLAAESRSERAA